MDSFLINVVLGRNSYWTSGDCVLRFSAPDGLRFGLVVGRDKYGDTPPRKLLGGYLCALKDVFEYLGTRLQSEPIYGLETRLAPLRTSVSSDDLVVYSLSRLRAAVENPAAWYDEADRSVDPTALGIKEATEILGWAPLFSKRSDCSRYIKAGMTPSDIREWRLAGFTDSASSRFIRAGYSQSTANTWLECGLTLEDATAWAPLIQPKKLSQPERAILRAGTFIRHGHEAAEVGRMCARLSLDLLDLPMAWVTSASESPTLDGWKAPESSSPAIKSTGEAPACNRKLPCTCHSHTLGGRLMPANDITQEPGYTFVSQSQAEIDRFFADKQDLIDEMPEWDWAGRLRGGLWRLHEDGALADDVTDSLTITLRKMRSGGSLDGFWHYFCGVMRRKAENREALAIEANDFPEPTEESTPKVEDLLHSPGKMTTEEFLRMVPMRKLIAEVRRRTEVQLDRDGAQEAHAHVDVLEATQHLGQRSLADR